MAKVFGEPGKHAGRQSVEAFKRMFKTVFVFGLVVAFCEGVLLTLSVTTHARPALLFLSGALGIFLLWLAYDANRRVDKHETDRMSWRKGAVGEYEVGAELERLSDDYSVFNNVNTSTFGNFDHIVVGPTGLFAIETKNWKGSIAANGAGELTKNGRDSSTPHVQNFFRRAMQLKDQVVALTHFEDARVQCVMVFPKAHVTAQFRSTGYVHCLELDRLRDYITNEKYSQRLGPTKVDRYIRAVEAVAAMDEEFEGKLNLKS
jgi:hypothetical protein